jgi:hypothetical protein
MHGIAALGDEAHAADVAVPCAELSSSDGGDQ